MRRFTHPTFLAIVGFALFSACSPDLEVKESDIPSQVEAQRTSTATGELQVGAAEDYLVMPVGTPLGAYTGRLEMGHTAPDERESPYCTEFEPSFGIQTRIPIRVLWFHNGDSDVVMIKLDIGYAFDGIVFQLYQSITDATGVDVTDKVLLATSHSHSSYGDFSNDVALYLGSDQFNREIFESLITQLTQVAEVAYYNLAPAAIGVGYDPEFDPTTEDRIFRDRRDENDDLLGVDGEVLGRHKDPRLTLLRIDYSQGTADPSDDSPMALVHHFGIHGTIMGEENPLASVEASGHIDWRTQEMFDEQVVVMHLQGAGGDQSPAGFQDDFARMETLGERAAPKIMALWEQVETASGDISIEMLTRSIKQGHQDIRVTRNGAVDLYYSPYTETYQGDDILYNEDGTIASPIDEFNTESGAALCDGNEDMQIISKLWGWPSQVAPYNTCGNVDQIIEVMALPIFEFDLDWVTTPLPTALSTVIGAIKLGPVPITWTDGTKATDNLIMGIFPGEPLSVYSDFFRKYVQEQYGYSNVIPIGYSQDHEGYLLTVEDWLAGGYEPEINQWGPLQGEFIMEQVIELIGQFGINDPNIPASSIPHPEFEYFDLNPAVPDETPNAGTIPNRLPRYLYTWDGVMPTTAAPDLQIPRVSGIATFTWIGGDPIVDLPSVLLQREEPAGSGHFETVTHPSGRPWSEAGPEIILQYTPDPLKDPGTQTHYWVATFQAVTNQPSIDHSAGLPTGLYRFLVSGQSVASLSDNSYPWRTEPYTVEGPPFRIIPLDEIEVSANYASDILNLTAAYPAVERGFRLISMNASDEQETSPLAQGDYTTPIAALTLRNDQGIIIYSYQAIPLTTNTGYSSATLSIPDLTAGTYSVELEDIFGNSGQGTMIVN